MRGDSLVFLGEPLFAQGSLHDALVEAVRKRVIEEFTTMPRVGRAFSQLRLRRHMAERQFGQRVAITPGTTVELVGEADDGRFRAEHRSTIEGTPDLLYFGATGEAPDPPLLARIDGDQLVLMVVFVPREWGFVSQLVRRQLGRIEVQVAELVAVTKAFEANLPAHIKRAVAQEWPGLTGQIVSTSR